MPRYMIHRNLLVILLVALSAVGADGAENQKMRRAKTGKVPGEYIVKLPATLATSEIRELAESITAKHHGTLLQVFENVRMFHCRITDKDADKMADDARVEYVAQDIRIPGPTTQVSATQWSYLNGEYLWHLDRLDEFTWAQRDGRYNMCPEGRSVHAYLIDTGVLRTHQEFEPNQTNRVVATMDFTIDAGAGNQDVTNACTTVPFPAGNWVHGTMTASALAGTSVGAAKPQVVSLKVMECNSGQILGSALIAAVNWIRSANDPFRDNPAVINHSGFLLPSQADFTAYADAVALRVTQTNVPFFTSADNFGVDACQFSPNNRAYTRSRTNGTVFVVGGTAVQGDADVRWQTWDESGQPRMGPDSGSNAGDCVSAYLPAVDIYVAQPRRDGNINSYWRRTGTSFSAPLAAAVAARRIQVRRGLGYTPNHIDVYNYLLDQGFTTVNGTGTPERWACFGAQPGVPNTWHATNPRECGSDQSGPFFFPATNSSAARMINGDFGYGENCFP